jgi:hypothetical protein
VLRLNVVTGVPLVLSRAFALPTPCGYFVWTFVQFFQTYGIGGDERSNLHSGLLSRFAIRWHRPAEPSTGKPANAANGFGRPRRNVSMSRAGMCRSIEKFETSARSIDSTRRLRHHRSQALATHRESTSGRFGKNDGMNVALIVIVFLMLFVPFVLVGVLFVWGAAKDGQEDRAVSVS